MTQQSAYPLDYTQSKASANAKDDEATTTSESMAEYAQKAQDALKNVRPFLDKSLKEQPMQTLAAMAALGFVLGAMWKK